MNTVGVIGLGNMGSGMAASLRRHGLQVVGYSATAQTRKRMADKGFEVTESLGPLAAAADIVLLSLPGPDSVAQVIEGPDGLMQHLRAGQMVIDCTTSNAATTRRLAGQLQLIDVSMIDAPVSGAPEVAERGELTIMVGGTANDVARAKPLLDAIGSRILHVGQLGAGNLAKLANNLMAAAHFIVAGEITALAQAGGLDVASFLDVINASTGRSFITERVYPNWILNDRFDLGFSMKLMRKDVRLADEQIRDLKLDLPLASHVAAQWLRSDHLVSDTEDITRIVELPARRMADAKPRPPSVG